MNLLNFFKSKKFEEMFKTALNAEMTKSPEKTYEQMADSYLLLLKLLKVDEFSSFCFPNYEDCRRVTVDGTEYDFDNQFRHNDRKATEALCEIDSLIADLEDDLKQILKKTEEIINTRKRK
jgi:hypothetical protein